MAICNRFTTKDTALIACFTALYVALSFVPMFPVVGLFAFITAATMIAPLIGIILGAYRGAISAFLGGVIGLFLNPTFLYPSLAAGVATALCAGLLYANKRALCALIYLSLLLLFGLYPFVGPVWLYPPMMWFQILGFIILISPLQYLASKNINSNSNSRLLYAFFMVSLPSTLAGQIAGSLIFEIMIPDTSFLTGIWISLTFLYPVERTAIAVIVTLIGVPLQRVLKYANLTQAGQGQILPRKVPMKKQSFGGIIMSAEP